MFSTIEGLQRAGKTYYCVTLINDILATQNRDIFTNLPIQPDRIASYNSKTPFDKQRMLDKIHLFTDFSLHHLKELARNNPTWWQFNIRNKHREYKTKMRNKQTGMIEHVYFDEKNIEIKINIFSQEQRILNVEKGTQIHKDKGYKRTVIIQVQKVLRGERVEVDMEGEECYLGIPFFWETATTGSSIFFDEAYEWFSAGNHKKTGMSRQRELLLSATRQHGHHKQDLYLISHRISDLDKIIRDGVMYYYVVKNSKYTNMFPDCKMMRGLKWPIQFFIIDGYEGASMQHSDHWKKGTDKRIFELYNTHNHSSLVGKKETIETHGSDDKIDHKKEIKKFFSQFYLVIIMGISACFGLYLMLQFIYSLVNLDSKAIGSTMSNSGTSTKIEEKEIIQPIQEEKQEEKTKGEKNESDNKPNNQDNNKVPDKQNIKQVVQEEIEQPKLIFKSNYKLLWDDGHVITVGSYYKKFAVLRIEVRNEKIILGNVATRQTFSIPFTGIRK